MFIKEKDKDNLEKIDQINNKDWKEQPCQLDVFFEEQQKKVPWLRSHGALLVCRCPKCRIVC